MIRAQRLAQNAPHYSLEDGHGQAGSSSQQLRRESTPHATLGSDMLQPTQSITNAKLRLLLRSVPDNVPAKRGMGQQQLGQKMGNLQKKSCRQRAASGKNTHIYTVNARPHKKCKVKLPGQGLGCTRPSPRGKPRAARGRDSGARNGTNTATPKRDIFCRDSITALCSQQ